MTETYGQKGSNNNKKKVRSWGKKTTTTKKKDGLIYNDRRSRLLAAGDAEGEFIE